MIVSRKIDELVEGMEVADDVIDPGTGVVLVNKGVEINKNIIDKLKLNGVNILSIREKTNEDMVNKRVQREYEQVESTLNSIFDGVSRGGSLETGKIIEDMTKFVDAITSERDIFTQMQLLQVKDNYTFNHSMGVSILSITLAKWLNYSKQDVFNISMAGLLHDIGKLQIPDKILNKKGRFTVEERAEMNRHSFYSYKITSETGKFSNDILLGVLQHHEKIDGSGYPNGVYGGRIHEFAKVIAVCDIYHALSSNRVYRDKDLPFKTLEYLRGESFGTLDPHITQVFLRHIGQTYVGKNVKLSDGRTGSIVYVNSMDKIVPVVKVGTEFIDFGKEKDIKILDIIDIVV